MQATLHDELKGLLVESLKLETPADEIGDEQPLFGEEGLGLDSLDVLELAVALEYRFGFQLQLDAEEGRRVFTNIKSLAEFVNEKRTK
ncbi:MAG: acyl carrier protein [Myxococcales bacterium]|nr:acyl carrier protein [Myxococcales bacterium]MCB9651750.1 acyl carrier protein [Deltaproteobacteria bacterium]